MSYSRRDFLAISDFWSFLDLFYDMFPGGNCYARNVQSPVGCVQSLIDEESGLYSLLLLLPGGHGPVRGSSQGARKRSVLRD